MKMDWKEGKTRVKIGSLLVCEFYGQPFDHPFRQQLVLAPSSPQENRYSRPVVARSVSFYRYVSYSAVSHASCCHPNNRTSSQFLFVLPPMRSTL